MANPDKVQTKDGGTIWNHQGYDNYKNASITEEAMQNENLDSFIDPTGLFKGFWNDITGVTSQSREFAQQEYLQDKMNAYNTPVQQMARMKEAGINPNLAAQGIAGGGNESAQAPQVASNAGGVAQGLSSVGSVVGDVAGALASLSASRKDDAEATKINETLPLEKNFLRASTYQSWANGGFAEEQAIGLSIENLYRGESCRLDIASKYLNLDQMQSEIDLLDAQYFTEKKKLDLMQSEIDLNKSNMSLNELRGQTEVLTQETIKLNNWYQQQNNEFRARWNFDPQWSSNAIMYGIMSNRKLSIGEKKLAVSNMLKSAFYSSFVDSAGAAYGSYDTSKGLIQLQGDIDKSVNRSNKNIDIRNSMINKWIRVPSHVKFGPFDMTTE